MKKVCKPNTFISGLIFYGSSFILEEGGNVPSGSLILEYSKSVVAVYSWGVLKEIRNYGRLGKIRISSLARYIV